MKRFLGLILILIIMVSVPSMAMVELNDIDGHWAEEHIRNLVENGVVNGYADNSFKPQGTIKVVEFIKLSVAVLGNTYDTSGFDYWATPYIDKAIELGMIYDGQFDSYERPITREEMAYIGIKALGNIQTVTATDRADDVIANIADYNKVGFNYKNDVINSYVVGLITGMPSGEFLPLGNATRAEASVVIARIIDDGLRNPFVFDVKEPVGVTVDDPIDYSGNEVTGLNELVGVGMYDEKTNKSTVETSTDTRRMDLNVRLDAFGEESKHPYLLTFYNCESANELTYYEETNADLVDSIMDQIFGDNASEGKVAIEKGIYDALTALGGTYADRRYLADGREADVVFYHEENKLAFHISNPIY